ncbi:hypothetical protein GOP47_0024071 [Adiantum capillus-veneris]|uniref:WRKY19-like zinc finger domain-containing protein n=1 Tax=Adiantum capillus-veneris TaxID=13818 RepID=A0A9D4U4R8_ADICA|nr:hypothetical protein GOP47_0024071 [Adiantum capillus-veneris]
MEYPSHRGGAPVDMPVTSLSIGGFTGGEESVGDLHRSAATMSQSPWGGMVQNPWFNGSGSSKRKRVNDGTSRNIFSQDAAAPSTSPSKSTGSQSSSGTMFVRGMEDECFPTDLGLGLTAPYCEGDHLYDALSQGQTVQQGFLFDSKQSDVEFIGSQGRKNSDMGIVDPIIHDLGMQLQLGLSGSSSVTADADFMSNAPFALVQSATYQEPRNEALSCESIPIVDEGSTSARSIKAGGYIPSLLMGRRLESLPSFEIERRKEQSGGKIDGMFCDHIGETCVAFTDKETASQTNILMNARTSSGTTSTSVPSASCERAPKTCKFRGCNKGARGASGLCIIHGGGRRCQRQGCSKGAEGSTVYCKSHGGGRRCESLGCTKSAEGKTDYCIAHGGGRRCSHDECTKAARGRSGLCIRHGGGKRCQREGCTKSAEGYSGLCISHGGGRRCQYEGCKKGAQGSTMFCKAHGGGKRCMIQGCNKGAEGSTPLCKGHGGGKRCMFEGGGICTKSVHGGTSFCVAHGGGKRCAVTDCTKSARGRTDFCVRHGGGKRCKVENCTKSAQGSTDFCKAHGGGKRCCWGQEGSPYSEFVKDKTGDLFKGPCERFARGKLGLCAAHSALVQDRRVHGAGTIGTTLSSGIGPGLFRGIVEGSIHAGNNMESADSASKLSMHGRNGLGDVSGAECARQEPFILAGRLSEDKGVGRQDGASELPSNALRYTPGLTFDGSSLKFPEEERLATDKVDGGLSDYGMGLWSGVSLPDVSNTSAPADFAPEKSAAPTHTLPDDNILTTVMAGPDISFERPVLPPQVLVPLSMRKGDLFFQDKRAPLHTGSSRSNYTDIFSMSSVSLPQRREVEQRVHGGSALALLSGRLLSYGAHADQ